MIDSIIALPQSWRFTPVRDKAPYLKDWNSRLVSRDDVIKDLDIGKATGYGIRLGKPSGYVLEIDWSRDRFGELPKTVTWTSGKPGRYQALFQVPESYRELVKTKQVKTGNGEAIEFRYTGCQSVLPPSKHPETEGYVWVNSPIDTPVADLPQVVIDYLLASESKRDTKSVSISGDTPPIPIEKCLAQSNQKLLDGTREGGRNSAGTKLAKDLIGCANFLESEGVSDDGDPRELFDRFAERCEPPLDPREADTIWQSAQKSNPDPSRRCEGVSKVVEVWSIKRANDTPQKQPRVTAGDTLLEIGKTATYFHTTDKIAYADITIDGNRHTYPVRSRAFRLWLSGEFYKREGKGISSQALQDTLNTKEGNQLNNTRLDRSFFGDLLLMFAPTLGSFWGLFFGTIFAAAGGGWRVLFCFTLIGLGVGILLKMVVMYPDYDNAIETDVLKLMSDPYANPLRGRPVKLSGDIIGRGDSGNKFGSDLVIHDPTGKITLHYSSHFGAIGNMLFGWTQADNPIDQKVHTVG